ncbi:AI-2E family transporter [bacterium]|jgi:predicted PurR-regulated permease PerM|nr:AI-2E family transporter [bacterium]MBT6293890.1 AI-2E family transporter [bacterium]
MLKKTKTIVKILHKKFKEIQNQPEVIEEHPEIEVKQENLEKRFIHLSLPDFTKAIVILIGLALSAFVLFEIKGLLFLLFFSYLFSQALVPFVEKLSKFKIPKGLSITFVFIFVIGMISIFLGNFIPILSNELLALGVQAQNLIEAVINGETKLPRMLEWINPILESSFAGLETNQLTQDLEKNLVDIGQNLRGVAQNAVGLFVSISNGFANAILVLFLTYFMTVDHKMVDKFIISFFKDEYQDYIESKSKSIKNKVGQWLQGQILLMLAVGLCTYIGLEIIGMEYSFTLAVLAGLTELIPVVGPLIAWVAAIPIAGNESSTMILSVTILYFIIQRIENNFLVPFIMNKATGLHPIIVLISMLVGYQFKGILGVIISIPIAGIISIFYQDFIVKIHPSQKK